MTAHDERLLQLIRLDRWLQRRGTRRLWMETTGLAAALACLVDLLAALSLQWFPLDPACPVLDDFGRCIDPTGLSPMVLLAGWGITALVGGSVALMQSWRYLNGCQTGRGSRPRAQRGSCIDS